MTGEYAFYIVASYAVAFTVLGFATAASILAWRRVKKGGKRDA